MIQTNGLTKHLTIIISMVRPLVFLGLFAPLLPDVEGGSALQTAAKFNPLTYVVDAERALFNGDIWASTTVTGAVSAVLVAALGLAVGVRAMQKDA
ncbi:hypothetical protein [Actinoplanes sp. NBRC 103695]|uniref:hypothetical protein n=1 Tax=Actinoplanes sp. NBRC 103695 TaxID=3032202 RepID=UPI0024A49516|nr:hypothetical protein [Actinoplanes sp. NBRC 103695]GLY96702.1 hypothetical protein Acsp02_39570 [Actinoplanes sp. NBRC 103695]